MSRRGSWCGRPAPSIARRGLRGVSFEDIFSMGNANEALDIRLSARRLGDKMQQSDWMF
jgi:hypothetical protein